MKDTEVKGTGSAAADVAAARATLKAALGSGDKNAIDRQLDRDFTAIDTDGRTSEGASAQDGLVRNGYGDDRAPAVRDYDDVVLLIDRRPADKAEITVAEVWVKRPEGWRLLTHHLNVIADPNGPTPHPAHNERPADAPPPDCPNPLKHVPYEPKRDEERGMIEAFQALEDAVVRNDADEWVPHVADEFIVFRTRQHPTTKAQRVEAMRKQKAINAEIFVAAVETMRLWVFGRVVIMRADHRMPGERRPPYRATRLWVNRDGRWQMAVSQQTNRPA